jgi:apolipoprotein N-acyltransferase
MPPKLRPWYDSTFAPALASAALLWAALPPLDLWLLGWIAPLGWVLLIRRREISGSRRYRTLWLVGFLFWLAAIHWLRLPHWLTGVGWVALSAYLAFYLPVFIALGRLAVHRLRVPLLLAVPVIFTGLELARAHVLTGFSMGSLAHTQYRWLTLIQVSDLGGEYVVDFIMMLVVTCLARMVPLKEVGEWGSGGVGETRQRTTFGASSRLPLSPSPQLFLSAWPLALAATVVAAALGYGMLRTSGQYTGPGGRIALIQGSIDVDFDLDESKRGNFFSHYCRLTQQAVRDYPRLDALVWPETMFPYSLISAEPDARPPAYWDCTLEKFQNWLTDQGPYGAQYGRHLLSAMGKAIGVPMIVGLEGQHFTATKNQGYNTAVLIDRSGAIAARYDKIHPVMFGEYIPLARYFPWIYRWLPMKASLESGHGPTAFHVGRLCLSPSICYETVLPHVIRSQVAGLTAAGDCPNVLVNLTNDGWFWGSSELDMHLVCGVFRAIECRKPLLIAANTGFSAWIDGDGRILLQGIRHASDVLLAEVQVDRRTSPYLRYGDLPAGVCLSFCAVVAIAGLGSRFRRKYR